MSTANDEAARREKFLHHVKFFEASSRYPAPYIGFTGQPGRKFEINWLPYDGSGFINARSTGPRIDPEEIRVFIVGDSTMAMGTEWTDIIPGRIEEILRKHYAGRVNVYNFGVVSSCTEQMCSLIWTRLLDLDPDVLVVASGATDAFQPYSFDPRPGYPYNFFINEFLYTHFFDGDNDKSWQSGLSYDDVVASAFGLLNHLRSSVNYGSTRWEEAVARSYMGSLIKLIRVAKAVPIPVLYFLEPIVVRKKDPDAAELSLASPEALSYLNRQYDRFSSSLLDLGAHRLPNNLSLIDASRSLNDEGPGQFYDIVHYDSVGRATVAQYFANQVLDALSKRGNSRLKQNGGGWIRNLFNRSKHAPAKGA